MSDLDDVILELEKDAAMPGSRFIDRAAHGIKGFIQGANQRAGVPQAGAAAQRVAARLPIEEQHNALGALPDAAFERGLGALKAQWQSGMAGARAHIDARNLANDIALAKNLPQSVSHAVEVKSNASAPFATYHRTQAIDPNSVGVAKPAGGNFLASARQAAPTVAGGLALAGLGYGAARGLQPAQEQDARMQDYMNNARHNMTTQLPSMTVQASHDEFFAEKLAFVNPTFGGHVHGALTKSISDQLASKLVGDPIDSIHRSVKKKLYDEPKWNEAFQHAVQNDPLLQKAFAEKPEVLHDVFTSMKAFSPSLAKDRLATKSFLRNAMLTDGNIDWGSMRMLTEIEKFKQESKRRST